MQITQEQKEQLAYALEQERSFITDDSNAIQEHCAAIHYLKTGEYSQEQYYKFELLSDCMNDFHNLYRTYCPPSHE